MYTEDIFNPKRQVLDVKEMEAGVKWFLEERTGQKVEVNVYKRFWEEGRNPLLLRLDVKKLHKLFTVALHYYLTEVKNNC